MKGSNFFAFLGGVIVGGAVALLLAPESGEKTREKIKDFIDKEYDDLKDGYNDMSRRVKRTVDREKSDVRAAVEEVKKGVHNGIEKLREE